LVYLTLLAAVPHTPAWSPSVAIVMILANLVALAIGRPAIQKRGVGPSLPVEVPGLFSGFGWPELLAVACFGHILGTGLILGLANAGVL
jgi:photosystem I subunit 10